MQAAWTAGLSCLRGVQVFVKQHFAAMRTVGGFEYPDLHFRCVRGVDGTRIDVSNQNVGMQDLPTIAQELAQMEFPKEGRLLLDLSSNNFQKEDVGALVGLLAQHTRLDISVARNCMGSEELRELREVDGGGPKLWRYLRDGRLTLESTSGHSLTEQIHRLHLSAATTLRRMDTYTHLHRGDGDFFQEQEVHDALASHLHATGCTVRDSGLPTAMLGVSGKVIYDFDDMLLSTDATGTATLLVGEVRHHLTADDVSTAEEKLGRLRRRLAWLLDGSMPREGSVFYVAQLQYLETLMRVTHMQPSDVRLFVGGALFDEAAVNAAEAGGYLIVAPGFSGFDVMAAWQVIVEVEEVEDEEV